jgi:hypothetical protein
MRKFSLLTAVLLLSCTWAVAQTSPSTDSSQNPSSAQPSAQSPSSTSPSSTSPSATMPSAQQPDTSAAGAGSEKGNAIEGCLSGSAGNFTLTDASGSTYQLAGDTSKLADHVGHQVRVWGDSSSASSGAATGAGSTATAGASSPQTLNVKRVKMISSSCATK